MKHFHLLITAGQQLDETTRFFKVAVPASKQGDRDFLFLTAFAVAHGSYWHLYDNEAKDFLDKVAVSLVGRPDANASHLDGLMVVDARCMVRHLKAGTLPSRDSIELHNKHFVRSLIDSNYYFSNQKSKIKRK